MPIKQLTPAVKAVYQTVVGRDISVEVLITNLNQDVPSATYFSDIVKSLPALSMDDAGKITVFESIRRRVQNNVNVKPIGKGTYGTIYRNQIGDAVYKKIEFDAAKPLELEENCREVFLEAFIQTVLSSDDSYGKNIARIIGIFRETPDKVIAGKRTLYIKMETVPKTIDKYLEELKTASNTGLITYTQFKPFLLSLGEIMDYFLKNYGFHHRDMHTGNVMFSAGSEIKLIDFGRSCMKLKVDGTQVTYSVVRENVVVQPGELGIRIEPQLRKSPCDSYDLLIFLSSLLEFDGTKFDETANKNMQSFMTQPTGTDIYAYWKINKVPKSPVFWKMYPDVVASWEGMEQRIRRSPQVLELDKLTPSTTPIASPSFFTTAVSAAPAAGGRRSRRSRVAVRRRRSKQTRRR
jgi:serine/threonine protein kinase